MDTLAHCFILLLSLAFAYENKIRRGTFEQIQSCPNGTEGGQSSTSKVAGLIACTKSCIELDRDGDGCGYSFYNDLTRECQVGGCPAVGGIGSLYLHTSNGKFTFVF